MTKIIVPFFASLFLAGSYVAGKYTTIDLGPLTASFLRYAVALVFLAVLVMRSGNGTLKANRRDHVKFFCLGLTGIVGYHYFFFSALRHTEVTNTAIINGLSPVVTGLMAAGLIKERMGLWNYIGILLAFIGVLLLLIKGRLENLLGLNFAVGDLLMLCAVFCWAVYALLVKNLQNKYSSLTITFFSALYGTGLLFFLAFTDDLYGSLLKISWLSAGSILYMGIFASGAGYLLYNQSIRQIGPTKTSSFVYGVVPILVAVLSWLFFREPVTTAMLISAAMIIAGLQMMLKGIDGQRH